MIIYLGFLVAKHRQKRVENLCASMLPLRRVGGMSPYQPWREGVDNASRPSDIITGGGLLSTVLFDSKYFKQTTNPNDSTNELSTIQSISSRLCQSTRDTRAQPRSLQTIALQRKREGGDICRPRKIRNFEIFLGEKNGD